MNTETITLFLARALEPLSKHLSEENALPFLYSLGLPAPSADLDGVIQSAGNIVLKTEAMVAQLPAFSQAIEQKNKTDILENTYLVTGSIVDIISAIKDLSAAVNDLDLSSLSQEIKLDYQKFIGEIPTRIINFLLVNHIKHYSLNGYNTAVLLGLFEEKHHRDVRGVIPEHTEFIVNWERVTGIVQDPYRVLSDVYNWGRDDFEWDMFLHNIFFLVVNSEFAFIQNNEEKNIRYLRMMLVDLYPTDDIPPGLKAETRANLTKGATKTWNLTDNIDLIASITGALNAGASIELHPDGAFLINPPDGSFEGAAFLALKIHDPANPRITLIGSETGSRIEAKQLLIKAGADVQMGTGNGTTSELVVSAHMDNASFVLDISGADGFLKNILPSEGFSLNFDAKINWSKSKGLHFESQMGTDLAFILPTNFSLGPIDVKSLKVELGLEGKGLNLRSSAAISGAFGPLTFSVGGIGAETKLSISEDMSGKLGIIDVSTSFVPPNEIGLTIDTGAVTGGGYLRLNPEKGEYSGTLQLEFAKIGLNAIGILNTKMPDGSKGYSLLLIITAEFTPAIQLGFGFNLSKVGGLFGAHRNVLVNVMRDGLRSNSLGNILFPHDPVNNAPSIISNLSSIFPVQQNRYVFGPMASITWGTPKILTIELGLLLDMPSPLRLIILGRIRMALPTEEAALVKINLDMLGVIDFGEKSIAIDATLFDSRLTVYTLSGDMAMRMTYGNKPMFALSLGGMHPAFNKPPAFPTLDRLAISLSSGNNPRMRLEAYLALTSNTAQVGARLDLYAATGNWNVSGTLGFDALFQFSPFYFVVDVYGSVALKRKSKHIMGLLVTFTLSGPNQWRAKGKATIKILLFKGSISFDMTIGQKKPEALPSADIWPILKSALESDDNWSSELPKEGHTYAIFKESSSDKVHPLGIIRFRQQVVPFHLEIEKFGNAQPVGATVFSIEGVDVNDAAISETKEYFAPAQFLSLSDSEKLSRPSFESFTAGAEVQSEAANVSDGISKELKYKQIIVDGPQDLPLRIKLKLHPKFQSVINRNKTALGKGFSKAGFARYAAPTIGIKMHEKAYAITDKETMTPVDFKGGSYAESAQRLHRMEAKNTHQVVEQNELL